MLIVNQNHLINMCCKFYHMKLFSFVFALLFRSIVVNPANISSGLHYYEVYGIDYKAPWRGPIFRVPITVIKPITLLGEPPLLSISNLPFRSGNNFCHFLTKFLFLLKLYVRLFLDVPDYVCVLKLFLDSQIILFLLIKVYENIYLFSQSLAKLCNPQISLTQCNLFRKIVFS